MSKRSSRVSEEDYLAWLGTQLRDEEPNPNRGYWGLLRAMYEKEFTWTVSMDDNRIADGLELRVDFRRDQNIRDSLMPRLGPCSFLEVLIALSRRLAFAAGGNADGWAWQLVTNLELDRMWDPLTPPKQRKTEEIMDRVIQRTYLPSGVGGFFPLLHPEDDMTRLDLWFQMHAYISELHPEH